MTSGYWKPDDFFRHADHLALYVGASELFGLMKRSMSLPPQWAALVGRETGDFSVVRAGGFLESNNVASVMFVRVSPFDVSFEEDHLITRDHYHLRAAVQVRLHLIPSRMELRSFFTRIVGSRRVAKIDAVARYFAPSVRGALARIAGDHDAADLVDVSPTDAVMKAVADAINAECFSAGLTAVGQPSLRFESVAFREDQAARRKAASSREEHQTQRQLERAIEQAQVEHLDHLSTLLHSVKDLSDESPDVQLPDLIRSFDEQQRGELYAALFAADQPLSSTRWIVVAAGRELLFFDPKKIDRPSRRLTMEGAAGAVRSIQFVQREDENSFLLLGAGVGVYRLPIDANSPDLTLVVPGAPSVRGGFNSVTLAGTRVVASHSELGLCTWNLQDANTPGRLFESMTKDADAVRDVQRSEADLFASIDDRILRWQADDPTPAAPLVLTGSRATITALCPAEGAVFAGNSEGDVLRWHDGGDADSEMLHRGSGRPAESVRILSTHSVQRLVFVDTSLSVHARVLGDSFVCNYEAGGQTLRRVEVAPDIIVATNDLRDRLLCWAPGQPARPHTTVGVSALCGSSIQDVCLVPTG